MAEEVKRKVRSDAGKKRVPRGLRGAAEAEFDAEDLAASAEAQGGGEVAAALEGVMEELRGLHRRMEAMEGQARGERGNRWGWRYDEGWDEPALRQRWRELQEGRLTVEQERRGGAPARARHRMPELPDAEIGDNLGLPNEFWSQFAAMFLKTCNVLCPVSDAPTREAAAFVRWTGMVKQYARQRISGYRPADLKKGGG